MEIRTGYQNYSIYNSKPEARLPQTPANGALISSADKNNASRPALSEAETRLLKKTGQIECQTCKNRKYQDGSSDPGVSFKAPGHIAPENSGAAVMAHEQEHVSRAQSKAAQNDREVVAQSVKIFTSTCPECGRTYVSGGETRTVTASKPGNTSDKYNQKSSAGKMLDIRI